MRTVLRALFTTLLAVAIALPGMSDLVLYSCNLDGQTRTSHCCDEGEQARGATLSTNDRCCDKHEVKRATVPGVEQIKLQTPESTVVATLTPPPVTARPTLRARRTRVAPAPPRAPPDPPGPPIYISVCSLLS